MRALILLLLLIAFPALASDLVVRDKESGDELRLLDSQCAHAGTLALIPEQLRAEFKNARVLDKRGTILVYGCWISYKDEAAVIVLETGEQFALKLSAFKDPTV